jgi:hypothetical protein
VYAAVDGEATKKEKIKELRTRKTEKIKTEGMC